MANEIFETSIECRNTDSGDRYFNVIHHQAIADGDSPAAEENLARALGALFTVAVLPLLSNRCKFIQTKTQRIFPLPRTNGFIFESQANETGAGAGDPLPGQCALILRKRSNFAGRKFRGRVFVFGLSEPDQLNGLFNNGLVGGMKLAWEPILVQPVDGFLGGLFQGVICPKAPTSSLQAVQITNLATDDVVRTQRRRTRGSGI